MPKKLVLPRENLFRAAYAVPVSNGETQRAVSLPEGDGRTLQLQWYRSDVWTEIDSWYEGNFMERIAPGAAKKTIAENKANMRILLQHGRDPQLGQKPIAPIDLVEENELGGYAEGRLFDGLDQLVVDGLRSGQYGASFQFRVMRDELVQEPGPSDYNPKGLPERTIKEMGVQEFGPVTWGAYPDASAGVRSLTDEIHFGIFRDMPPKKLAELAGFWHRSKRMDSEDVGTIAQMLTLASCYVEDQDEMDEQGNLAAMQAIQAELIKLLPIEAAENEPPEEEENSSTPTGTTPERRAEETGAPAEERDEKRDDATPPVEKDYLREGRQTPPWFLS